MRDSRSGRIEYPSSRRALSCETTAFETLARSMSAGEDSLIVTFGWGPVLLGVAEGDTDKDAKYLAEKIAGLRIFEDEDGKMNVSVADVGGG